MTTPKFTSAIGIVVLGVIWTTSPVVLSQDKAKSSEVVVDKTKITFDPKTCTEGRGVVYWGLGSSAVKMLGHRDGHCLFEYIAEVEMGYTYYFVKVPIDSGIVTIESAAPQEGIRTSFPLEKAKVVRRGGGRGHWDVRVGDTDEFVSFGPPERRSEMEPRKGDKAKFRFRLFDGPEFKTVLAKSANDASVEFVVGSEKCWPWLEAAMEHMTVGDMRQAEVPAKVAEGTRDWLGGAAAGARLYVEIRLVALERAK